MAETTTFTRKGFEEKEAELFDLKTRQRSEIAQKIKEAREQGDLSENAEYAAAKEEQSHIEGRIEELELLLKNAEVIDQDDMDADRVNLGMRVKVRNEQNGAVMDFNIVGTTEANSLSNNISDVSPIGRALMGSSVGQTVSFSAPVGTMSFTVLEISRSDS